MKSWRDVATPLLVEMADHAAAVLREAHGFDPEKADHAAFEIVRAFAKSVGGAQVYIPTADSLLRHERDEAIWRDFDGRNTLELARKYGVTVIHVCRIIKRKRAELRRASQNTPESPTNDDYKPRKG